MEKLISPVSLLKNLVNDYVRTRTQQPVTLPVQPTKEDFPGEITIVLFPLAKALRQPPQQVAHDLLDFLRTQEPGLIQNADLVGGFLNLQLSDAYWTQFLQQLNAGHPYPVFEPVDDTIVIEFSSPNTNKPQHLGHVRNNVLGWSVAQILQKTGHQRVIKVNLINDRGIHISKSMLAWMKWGQGITPEQAGKKGDHLIGDLYVRFEQEYKKQVNELVARGVPEEEAKEQAPLMQEARQLLRRWEAGDPDVLRIWKQLNEWVLKGFDETYKRLGIEFDAIDFESETYQLGKKIVEEGLQKGIFYRKEDGSVWVDLTDEGLDHKLLLRSDGTSVYITQDLGTIELRWQRYHMDLMIYVVAEEQEYHFKVLKAILKKLGRPYADAVYHLSYAMVDLPTGKMKSREGTVIDADDILDELHELAYSYVAKSEKTRDLSEEEKHQLAEQIALGAIKFFMLRVDPKKRILFRKEEALDLEGYTGPFIQYSHARIASMLRKAGEPPASLQPISASDEERRLLQQLAFYPEILAESSRKYDPSTLANYLYRLAKAFNRYYAQVPILKEVDATRRSWRLALSNAIKRTLHDGASLLGIPMPERM